MDSLGNRLRNARKKSAGLPYAAGQAPPAERRRRLAGPGEAPGAVFTIPAGLGRGLKSNDTSLSTSNFKKFLIGIRRYRVKFREMLIKIGEKKRQSYLKVALSLPFWL